MGSTCVQLYTKLISLSIVRNYMMCHEEEQHRDYQECFQYICGFVVMHICICSEGYVPYAYQVFIYWALGVGPSKIVDVKEEGF